MRQAITLGFVFTAALSMALTARAYAQAKPEAEKLFRDGRALLKDGKLAEACAAFEGSEKLEHNIATVLNLADCREKNQQFAAAWALFLEAERQTRADPASASFNATAKTRAAALESKLSYLTINVPDDSRVAELVVTRDDVVIDPVEWNRAIPVDGGEHVIAGKAPGHESWTTKITLAPSLDKQAVEVPKFKELPKLAHPEVGGVSGAVVVVPAPGMFTTRRKIGIGAVAAGVVLAGVGVGFGLSANNLRNEALSTCPPSACSPLNAAAAQHDNDQASSRSLDANISFAIAGGAVIAAGVLWFIGAPDSPSASTALRVVPAIGNTNGFTLIGRF